MGYIWETSGYCLSYNGITEPVQQIDETPFFHFRSVFHHLSLHLFIYPFYSSLFFVHNVSPFLCFLSFFLSFSLPYIFFIHILSVHTFVYVFLPFFLPFTFCACNFSLIFM